MAAAGCLCAGDYVGAAGGPRRERGARSLRSVQKEEAVCCVAQTGQSGGLAPRRRRACERAVRRAGDGLSAPKLGGTPAASGRRRARWLGVNAGRPLAARLRRRARAEARARFGFEESSTYASDCCGRQAAGGDEMAPARWKGFGGGSRAENPAARTTGAAQCAISFAYFCSLRPGVDCGVCLHEHSAARRRRARGAAVSTLFLSCSPAAAMSAKPLNTLFSGYKTTIFEARALQRARLRGQPPPCCAAAGAVGGPLAPRSHALPSFLPATLRFCRS
jgi:hypothetical protein